MATTRAGWPALGLGLAAALLASCGGPPLPEPSVVLYSRHYLEPIYLETVPEPEEVSRPVKIFAARGEYEPASVGVFSHQALAAARLEA
ncbi:MAG TPA: hypothetical protein ENK10_02235, partial [Acidobacteria bacterium]|nr:hypothetical protein [Acidobacteriota bacterium]